MTLKSDAIFEEKLTCGLENGMANLANFYQSTRKSQNWDFDGILLGKVENYWASNLQRSYVSWQWKMMPNLKRNWLAVSKLTPKFDKFWPEHWNTSKNLHFKDSFWPKYIIFDPKKHRRFMFDGTEDWCKIWSFQKWHEEFSKFLQAEK